MLEDMQPTPCQADRRLESRRGLLNESECLGALQREMGAPPLRSGGRHVVARSEPLVHALGARPHLAGMLCLVYVVMR